MLQVAYIHLYNDLSGSPAVLANAIKGLLERGYEATIITSRSEGKLSNIARAEYSYINYRFYDHKIMRLIMFLWAQIQLFIKILLLPLNTIVYVNTVLPFGAALGAWLTGKKVIYHMHESSVRPASLKKLLFSVANLTASKSIYVSKYLSEQEILANVESEVVYNALKPELSEALYKTPIADKEIKNILLICSLKDYKGIPEFIRLAQFMPRYDFTLIVNANLDEIQKYFSSYELTNNLKIYPSQKNLIPFYASASVVVNLSRNDEWMETFGLTILEGMTAGRPVIGQTAGGTAELINYGEYGYCIEGEKISELARIIMKLHTDRNLYVSMSELARKRSRDFSIKTQQAEIYNIIEELQSLDKSIVTS